MKDFYRMIITFMVLLFFTAQGYSQLSLGAVFGRLSPDTEFGQNLDEGGVGMSGFIRYNLFGPLNGQLTGTFGQVKSNDFATTVVPIDYRFLIRPVSFGGKGGLFVYGGVGALFYDIDELPVNANLSQSDDLFAWNAYVPVGGGVQIQMSERTALEFNGGYNHIFSDKFNGYTGGQDNNDGFWTMFAGISISGESGNADPDMDGLTNNVEKQLGTNPKLADTDGDGLDDGTEFNRYTSDPLKVDTDNDGLSDGDEVNTYGTSPTRADTDGDGLNDYDEIITYKTDPNNKDTDGDGLTDYDEIITRKTDPMNPDIDNDGFSDGDEIRAGTDMKNPDTDGDGLLDGDEVNKYKTNPLKKDTDGGGVDDYAEVTRGTNPLEADDDNVLNVAAGQKIVLEGVTFATGKADVTPESAQILQKALNTMNAYPDMEIEIRGYTDNVGSRNLNMRLSQRRADSVRDWLIQGGIDPTRIISKGFGPDNPIAPNNTPEGRKQNRRIEFVRIK
jgi:outer membrane protein OmpA-like peptidoglycan-associated protein